MSYVYTPLVQLGRDHALRDHVNLDLKYARHCILALIVNIWKVGEKKDSVLVIFANCPDIYGKQ